MDTNSNLSSTKACIHAFPNHSAPELNSPGMPGPSESTGERRRPARRGNSQSIVPPQETDYNSKSTKRPAPRTLHTQSAAKAAKRYQEGDASQGGRVQQPFRPEYIFSCFANASPSQHEEVINTTMEQIVAFRSYLRTVPSNVWLPSKSLRAIQPYNDETVFILPVNVHGGYWSCLVIRVGEREASLFDPLNGSEGTEAETMCKELASRFVSTCLPASLSNWNEGWRTVCSHHNSQRYEMIDSGIYCLGVAIYIALRLDVPVSFDIQLIRCFLRAICTNVNHVATTSAASTPVPGGSGNGQATTPVETAEGDASQNATLRLMNTLPSQWIPQFQNKTPEHLLKKLKGEIPGGETIGEVVPYVEECTRRQREVIGAINSYLDAKVSDLRPRQAAVNQLVTLARAICGLDRQVLATPDEVQHNLARLERVKAWSINAGRDDIVDSLEQPLALLGFYRNPEEERVKILERLQLAVALAHVDELADHLNKVADAYRELHTRQHYACLEES